MSLYPTTQRKASYSFCCSTACKYCT